MVQGVGYRYFCSTQARALGLTGWVRNETDGSVSVYVEGHRGLVETLLTDLKSGPRHASVTELSVRWCDPEHQYARFEIHH